MQVLGVDLISPVDQTLFSDFRLAISTSEEIRLLLDAYQPNFLVNLAGNAQVAKSFLDPRGDFEGSTYLTSSILELVRTCSPNTKYLHASSTAVYGEPKQLPITEAAPLQPVSPYGFHKMMAEFLVQEYAQIFNVRAASLRIFSAYGPGLRKQLLWDLCQKCFAGGDISLSGDGTESRDFVHSSDIAKAINIVLKMGPLRGESYNIASGDEVTISKIARRVLSEFGVPIDRLYFSGISRDGDPHNWRADISLIASLGFLPSMKISDGVAEYVTWFKQKQ